jgi:hypothetical protein
MSYKELENKLSKDFDELIAPLVLETYDADDEPAFNEAFSNWIDSLCKDGAITEDEYSNVCYVGKYS